MRDVIEINKELVPYSFNILLADEWFEIYISYNKTADMFTATIYRDDELISSAPMVLNEPLFRDVYQPTSFPSVELVPFDQSETAKAVSWENLGNTVFLTIDDEGEADE